MTFKWNNDNHLSKPVTFPFQELISENKCMVLMEPKRRPGEKVKFGVTDEETKYHQGKSPKKKAKDRCKASLSPNLILYLEFSVISKNIWYKDVKYLVSIVKCFSNSLVKH